MGPCQRLLQRSTPQNVQCRLYPRNEQYHDTFRTVESRTTDLFGSHAGDYVENYLVTGSDNAVLYVPSAYMGCSSAR